MNTTPVENIVQDSGFIMYLNALRHVMPRGDIVQSHKDVLGRQDTCKILGSERRRFYIWNLEELVILVHKVKGVCLEVPPDTTPQRVWELVHLYRDQIMTEDTDPRLRAFLCKDVTDAGEFWNEYIHTLASLRGSSE